MFMQILISKDDNNLEDNITMSCFHILNDEADGQVIFVCPHVSISKQFQ
jgi:hypothetical protein